MAASFKFGAAGAVMALLAAVPAQAQDSTNRVAVETAWSVFVDGTPRECWAVSAPSETVNTRDGRAVSVRRGDILLFATFRQGQGSTAEVSFTGGYPFAPDSTVEVAIGSDTFQLITDGEWAWAASPVVSAVLSSPASTWWPRLGASSGSGGDQWVNSSSSPASTAWATWA